MKRLVFILATAILFLGACGQGARSDELSGSAVGLSWQEQYDLGVRYLSEGKYEEAIIAFTAAIEIDPKQAPAYVGRGNAYVHSGKTDGNLVAAQADYEKAIELDGSDSDAYLGLANIYLSMGNTEMALQVLNDALDAVNNVSPIQRRLDELTAELTSEPSPDPGRGTPESL